MKTLTQEQYNEVLNAKHPKRVLKSFFEVEKLPYNNWYKSNNDSIVYFISENKGFGLWIGKRWDNGNWSNLNCGDWTLATDQEVKEMLTKQLVERFGEDWENCKIKECLYHSCNKFVNIGYFGVAFELNSIWNKNGLIFKDGKWAEKL